MDLAPFIADSLALWQVQGTVDANDQTIVVHAGNAAISIQRASDGPFRWVVTAEGRRRPCASVLGVLNALRRALNVDRGAPLRIA